MFRFSSALILFSKGIQEKVSVLLQEGRRGKELELQWRPDFPSTQRLSRSLEHCAGLLQYNKPISLAQEGLEFSFQITYFWELESIVAATSPSLTSFGPILSCNVKFCLTRTSNDLLDVWMPMVMRASVLEHFSHLLLPRSKLADSEEKCSQWMSMKFTISSLNSMAFLGKGK